MTVYGKPGKRKCCFSGFPKTLEIDKTDSHITTATTTTGMNENPPKTGRLRDTHSEGKVTGNQERKLQIIAAVERKRLDLVSIDDSSHDRSCCIYTLRRTRNHLNTCLAACNL